MSSPWMKSRPSDPEILDQKGKGKSTERCLSMPGVEVGIQRAYHVDVRGLNESENIS